MKGLLELAEFHDYHPWKSAAIFQLWPKIVLWRTYSFKSNQYMYTYFDYKTENTKSAVTPQLMAGSSPILIIGRPTSNKDTYHNIRVFDLTNYFWRSQRSKFKTAPLASWHVSLLFDLYCLRFYQISARSDFKYGRQATILENQLCIELIDITRHP
jgi:hypothetical protein